MNEFRAFVEPTVGAPWRAQNYGQGFVAEYLPPGQRTWRRLNSGGCPIVFRTASQAREAARNAYILRLEPTPRATVPVDGERVAAKMADEAENWLRSKREDVKAKETLYRAGKRPILVMPGRAR